jgi:imidazolonepropionase-like amidohydrolase
MPRISRSAALLAAASTLCNAAMLSAQLGSFNPAPGPQETIAIRNAHIFPVTGAPIANGTVLISGGKITAVGASVTVPSGAKVIDASGLSVYPGMMDAGTAMGLAEITEGANATVDDAEVGTYNPNVQAFFGIDPHSAHIGVTRVVGITNVVSSPSGGVLSGQAALINLSGDTSPQMAVVPRVAMVINLPGGGGGRGGGGGGGGFAGGRGGGGGSSAGLDSLKALLRDADAYGKAQDAWAKDKTLPRPKSDLVLASLLPMLRGQMPAIFNAETAANIREAIAFAQEFHIKPIIMGGRDALKVADLLKSTDTPVIWKHTMDLPSGEDTPYDANYGMPGKLAAAGIRFAIASGEPNPDVRNLPYNAGMAAAFGMSKEDALKSVTLWPAQIFGVGDKLGSIEVGKVANLVVTTGDMLEARTDTKYLIIDGRIVPLDTKHTQLNGMFKDRHE